MAARSDLGTSFEQYSTTSEGGLPGVASAAMQRL
jgi:hypothetical protein